jgi:hypothetical protein
MRASPQYFRRFQSDFREISVNILAYNRSRDSLHEILLAVDRYRRAHPDLESVIFVDRHQHQWFVAGRDGSGLLRIEEE